MPTQPVADGRIVYLSLWSTSIINLVVKCPAGKYFGSIRAPRNVYDQTFPLFGTTSLAAGGAADKCLSASPNYSPAAVLRYNALHSLYFVRRPAAKNSVSLVPF